MTDLRHAIDNFDLEGFVIEHGAREYQRGEWTLRCPWCDAFKFVVNMRRRSWHCWRCQRFEIRWTGDRYKRIAVAGAGGVIQLVMALDRCTRIEAEARLVQGAIRRPGELAKVDVSRLLEAPKTVAQSPAIAPPVGVQAFSELHPYLAYRGITWDDVQRFGLTWCAWGRYANRVVFPVFELGQLVYWQARAMWESEGSEFVKTLNPPKALGGVTSSEVLFNLDQAIACGGGRVCITEGPIDAIHAGFDAVCTFGKQISPTQIARLLRSGIDRVDLMWDADAQHEAEVAAVQLASYFAVRVVRLPSGDPGDWPRDKLHVFRDEAVGRTQASRLTRI